MSRRPMNAMPIGCARPETTVRDGKVRVEDCRRDGLALERTSRQDGNPDRRRRRGRRSNIGVPARPPRAVFTAVSSRSEMS